MTEDDDTDETAERPQWLLDLIATGHCSELAPGEVEASQREKAEAKGGASIIKEIF
jgi:hypothetical protein